MYGSGLVVIFYFCNRLICNPLRLAQVVIQSSASQLTHYLYSWQCDLHSVYIHISCYSRAAIWDSLYEITLYHVTIGASLSEPYTSVYSGTISLYVRLYACTYRMSNIRLVCHVHVHIILKVVSMANRQQDRIPGTKNSQKRGP